MASKTLGTIIILILGICMLPIVFGFVAGIFGAVIGVMGGIIGGIGGIIGGIIGGVFGLIGSIFHGIFGCHFNVAGNDFLAITLVVVIVVLLSKKNRLKSKAQR
jgi:hypothetical protein